MCIKQDEYNALLDAVAKVKHDTGNIRNGLQAVDNHFKKLNSRTAKVESKVENLEDAEYREVRCVQREVIDTIKNDMLTVSKFEEWEKKKEEKKERDVAKAMHSELVAVKHLETRQRKMQWVIAGIVGAGMIIMSLLTYLS